MRRIWLFWGISLLLASISLAQTQRPIRVIIIGVPENKKVHAYETSPLGGEIVKACDDLTKLFTNQSVEVDPLCKPENTTSANVHAVLKRSFSGSQVGRLTVIFVMAHGEVTPNNDVRLLLSDATDQDKDDKSLILKSELILPIENARDSVTLAFIDACYSGNALDLVIPAAGNAAEDQGTHSGVLASSLPDNQAFDALFTKSLIDIWNSKTTCPNDAAELSSELLSRMNNIPQSPLWLIRFHQSLCLPDLLSSKKHLISIYRQPDPKDLEISVFGASNKNGAAPAFAVSQDHVFSNPYIRASIPGKYRIEARNSSGNSTLLDHADCDITTLPYCKYFYPPSAKADVDSLNLQGAIYDAAVAYHYPASDLTKIADGAASIYSRILRDNPTKARVQATELRSSSRELWTSMGQSPQLARTQLQLLTAPDFPDELLGAVDKYEADNPGVRITAGQTFKPGAPTFAITYQRFSVHGGGVGSLAGSLGSIGPLVGGGSSLPSIAFLPIGVNALVPIYNLPGVEGEIVLTPEILGGAYLGRIKNWDDAAILRVNPGVSMPNMPIVVVHRTDSSESTSVWTDYLSKVSEDWARQVGTRDSVDWPTGIGAARNEGVESVVRERPGSLGYVDFGYALQRGLHYAEVENRAGNFVRADAQNVAAAAEGLKLTFEEIPSIVNSTAPNAYPIAGIVCVLADFSQREGTQAKSILDFVKWLNDWTIKPPGWYTALPPDVLQATRNEVDKLYK